MSALAAAFDYTIQWSVGGNYSDWSATHPVSVGDTVVFKYAPPHTVAQLSSEAAYKACNLGSKVFLDSSGGTGFTFDEPGTWYFACVTGSHSARGQKVAITVTGSSVRSPAKPEGNSAAAPVAGAAGVAVKLALGLLGVGGALLAAF
ncbi:hypothetical protein SETIT_7G248100v2 [Setaria italica]|uniref:Phytocyanin domain-containing protein n=1 Tax=Setaria italica TaxID=4555 RepID=K3YES1_SETIT|nr:hypothetical protein SETIT_7G248100v2 [Setaria italica]